MNKKGFTLIELIAVILILAAICLISYPALTNMMKKNKDIEFDKYKENLCLAGKTYINMNKDEERYANLDVESTEISIDISQLISYGNVESDLIDPKNNDSATNHRLIYTVLSDKTLDCNYE